MTRKEMKAWLQGKKLHGTIHNSYACTRNTPGLARGWKFTDGKDLRKITCKKCRAALKKFRSVV